MPQTLQTGGFRVNRFPELVDIDPRDFAADPTPVLKALMTYPAFRLALAQNQEDTFELGTKKATGPARRSKAVSEAEAAAMDQGVKNAIERARLDLEAETINPRREAGVINANTAVTTANTAAETASQAGRAAKAVSPDVERNAEIASQAGRAKGQADIEASRSEALKARLAQLPKHEVVQEDENGNQFKVVYADEPALTPGQPARRYEISRTQVATAEDIKNKRAMQAAQVKATEALATQRTGVGKVRTTTAKVRDRLGAETLITTSVDGTGRLLRITMTGPDGRTQDVPLPPEAIDEGETEEGVAPSAAPAPTAPKPTKTYTRETLLQAVASKEITREEAKAIAQAQGIQ